MFKEKSLIFNLPIEISYLFIYLDSQEYSKNKQSYLAKLLKIKTMYSSIHYENFC